MKSISPLQKYLLVIESDACILKILVTIFLFPVSFLTSFGIYSTPKLSKYVTFLAFTYRVPIDLY